MRSAGCSPLAASLGTRSLERRLSVSRVATPILVALSLAGLAPRAGSESSAAAPADCPSSAFRLRTFGDTIWDSTALDTVLVPDPRYRVAYDIVAGTLSVSKPPTNFGWVTAAPADLYDLQGPPAGTVVPVTVALDVDGHLVSVDGCGGRCYASLTARIIGGSAVMERRVDIRFIGRTDLVTTLELPTMFTVGQPVLLQFRLDIDVGAGSDGMGGAATGRIHFDGLPAGARINSCQGYASQVVSTRATTWGRLKTLYR